MSVVAAAQLPSAKGSEMWRVGSGKEGEDGRWEPLAAAGWEEEEEEGGEVSCGRWWR